MARSKRRTRNAAVWDLSPIHPSINFMLFLVLALLLVVIVAVVMRRTAQQTRANLFCPQSAVDSRQLITELSKRCPTGVEYVSDNNGCGVWTCRLTAPGPTKN